MSLMFSEADMTIPPEVTEPEEQGGSNGLTEEAAVADDGSVSDDDVHVLDENDDLEEVDSAAVGMIQARAALQLIQSLGRTPKYMRAVSYGSDIEECFVHNNSSIQTMALEAALTDGIGERLQSFKYAIGRWRDRLRETALAGLMLNLSIRIVAASNKYRSQLDKLKLRKYDVIVNNALRSHITFRSVVIKNNRECTVFVRVLDAAPFMREFNAFGARGVRDALNREAFLTTMAAISAVNNRIHRSMISKQIRIAKWTALAAVLAYAGGAITRNTPNALANAIKLDLPTDHEEYDMYGMAVAREISRNTAFSVRYRHNGDNSINNYEPDNAQDPIRNITDLTEHLKVREEVFKRFVGITELLDAKMKDAIASCNPYSIKAVSYLTSVCKAVIDRCSENSGTLYSVLQKLDKAMDQFHEEANAMSK